jgi:hypothetical protein
MPLFYGNFAAKSSALATCGNLATFVREHFMVTCNHFLSKAGRTRT